MACEVHHALSAPAGAPVVVLSCSLGTDLSMWAGGAAEGEDARAMQPTS